MGQDNREPIAFARPGGETCQPSRERPIDLVHLARQTLGDRSLEAEVLTMFLRQLSGIGDKIGRADAQERISIAHALKGTARGVGAFQLADCAARMEASPDDSAAQEDLARRIDDVCDFVATINR